MSADQHGVNVTQHGVNVTQHGVSVAQHGVSVGQLVSRAARRFGDRVALDGPQGQQTFTVLGARVHALARGLRGLGLRPGERILDLQTNQNSYIETDLATASAGLVRVALNYRLHPLDWSRIADDCGASALIYDGRFEEASEALRSGFGPHRTVAIGDAPGSAYERLILDHSTAPLPVGADLGDVLSLNYSSGTTGAPKGVRRTHRNRFASLVAMTFDVLGGVPGPADRYLHAGPITHTSGLFVLPFLVAGAPQLILPSWDPDAFIDAIVHRGATHTALVPTMVARLLAHPEATRERLAGLRMLGYAGAPMPPEQIRQAAERLTPNLVQYYGLVEAIPPVTVLDAADHARGLADDPHLLTSAGRPAFGVALRVVDERGATLPPGETGEVLIRGDLVMDGYWQAAGRTDLSKSIVDGWLRTGDLGRLSADERLWLTDRKGDMIISGGYNIYPREVEDVIAEVAGVREVAVVGVPDAEWGDRVVALYTIHSGASVAPVTILRHCQSRLAAYKKPKQVSQVDSFPLNSTGKISKKTLRERLVNGGDA